MKLMKRDSFSLRKIDECDSFVIRMDNGAEYEISTKGEGLFIRLIRGGVEMSVRPKASNLVIVDNIIKGVV